MEIINKNTQAEKVGNTAWCWVICGGSCIVFMYMWAVAYGVAAYSLFD